MKLGQWDRRNDEEVIWFLWRQSHGNSNDKREGLNKKEASPYTSERVESGRKRPVG